MIYRKLGRTGIDVSVIGVGTWQFGGEWGMDFTQPLVDDILDAAEECGINLIDTAECYGDHLSESLIGNYLKNRDRNKWFIATKFGHHFNSTLSNRTDQFDVKNVSYQLEKSLRALGAERLDLYQFHSGPDAVFSNDSLWTMLDKAKVAGKVRFLGLSLNKTTEKQADLAGSFGIDVLQLVYNRIDRRSESIHFPFADRDNLGVLARVPLASGFLSGKYKKSDSFLPNDVRSNLPHDVFERQINEVETIIREEIPHGVSVPAWALAWCLQHKSVTSVIPGCKSRAQVKSNSQAVEVLRSVFKVDK